MDESDNSAEHNEATPPKKNYNLWIFFGLCLLLICGVGYYILYTMDNADEKKEQAELKALEIDVRAFLDTSNRLQAQYAEKKRLSSLPSRLPVQVAADNSASWSLRRGQFAGAVDTANPDVALVVYPLTKSACGYINYILWMSSRIPESGMPISAFESGTADILALYDGRDRLSHCISVAGGVYLYYAVVGRDDVRLRGAAQ